MINIGRRPGKYISGRFHPCLLLLLLHPDALKNKFELSFILDFSFMICFSRERSNNPAVIINQEPFIFSTFIRFYCYSNKTRVYCMKRPSSKLKKSPGRSRTSDILSESIINARPESRGSSVETTTTTTTRRSKGRAEVLATRAWNCQVS